MLEFAFKLVIVWEELKLEFLELQQVIRLNVALGGLTANEVESLAFTNLPLGLHDPRDSLRNVLIGMRELLLNDLLSFFLSLNFGRKTFWLCQVDAFTLLLNQVLHTD